MFCSDRLEVAIRRRASCPVLTQTCSIYLPSKGTQRSAAPRLSIDSNLYIYILLHDYLITLLCIYIYITKCTLALQWVGHPSIYPAVSFKFQHERYDGIQAPAFMQTRQAYIIHLTLKKRTCLCAILLHGVILPIGVQSLGYAAIKWRNLYP